MPFSIPSLKMNVVNVYFRLNVIGVIHFLIVFTGILLVIYALLIFYYHRIWDRIPGAAASDQMRPGRPDENISATKVTVIIPARNEALRIGACLDCLYDQSYPKALTEIIFVDDFSTDETAAIIREHPLDCTLLHLADFISGSSEFL